MGQTLGIDWGKDCLLGVALKDTKQIWSAAYLRKAGDTGEAALKELLQDAARTLKAPVRNVSIAVPAWYSDVQLQKIHQFCRQAGLPAEGNHVRTIPALSAIALGDYCLRNASCQDAEQVLVLRLGEGLEAGIAEVGQSIVELRCCNGDSSLSADLFYARLASALAGTFRKTTGIDLRGNREAEARLLRASKKAIRELQTVHETTVQLPDLSNGLGLQGLISRSQFLELTQDLTMRVWKLANGVLEANRRLGDSQAQIRRVLLAGEAPHIYGIPGILRSDLTEALFPPPEAVCTAALGAAWHPTIREGDSDVLLLGSLLYDLHLESHHPLLHDVTVSPSTAKILLQKNDTDSGTIAIRKKRRDISSRPETELFLIRGFSPAKNDDPGIELTIGAEHSGLWTIRAMDMATKTELTVIPAKEGESAEPLLPMLFRKPDFTQAQEAMLMKMLSVYDNLERALNQPTTDAAYKKGIALTMKELLKIFSDMGMEFFAAPGDTFDPKLHNAVVHIYDGSRGENEITLVMERGVRRNGKILRYATVQVAN